MLSYETAKRLKDAGFPQVSRSYYLAEGLEPMMVSLQGAEEVTGVTYSGVKLEEGEPYHPTLSELIAACGERHKFSLNGVDGKFWVASVSHEETELKAGSGSTPEEAVAALYLALHEKKHPEA